MRGEYRHNGAPNIVIDVVQTHPIVSTVEGTPSAQVALDHIPPAQQVYERSTGDQTSSTHHTIDKLTNDTLHNTFCACDVLRLSLRFVQRNSELRLNY